MDNEGAGANSPNSDPLDGTQSAATLPINKGPEDTGTTGPARAVVGAARMVVQLLGKTAKASRIYDKNNDLYQRFWADLIGRLDAFFEQQDRLSIEITADRMLLDGEVIYEPRQKDDNFAFLLYKDGLRQLDFLRGMEPDEIERFMAIITTDFDHGTFVDQDISSLIWESDFKHIQTIAVESFAEEVDEDEAEELADKERAVMHDLEEVKMEALLQQAQDFHVLKLDAEERREYHQVSAGDSEFEVRNALDRGNLMDVSTEERIELVKEANALEQVETPIDLIGDILFELFRHEPPEEYADLLDVTVGLIESLLSSGDLEKVNALLAPVRLLASPEYARAFLHHERVLELFRRLGTTERLERLTQPINSGTLEGGAPALFQYVSYLTSENALGVLAWLQKIEDPEHRRAAVDGLIMVMNGDLGPFRDAARSSNASLVADVIHGMGRVGDVHSLEIIFGAFSHEDPVVRTEVLTALRDIQTPRARELTLLALKDPDEAVRMTAMRDLAIHRDRQGAQHLLKTLHGKEMKSRTFAEARGMCMAVAHMQGQEAYNQLKQLLLQPKYPVVAQAALHGLAVIGGREARRLIERMARDEDPQLAGAAAEALNALKD